MALRSRTVKTSGDSRSTRAAVGWLAILVIATIILGSIAAMIASSGGNSGGDPSGAAKGNYPASAELVALAWLNAEPSPIRHGRSVDPAMGRDPESENPSMGLRLGSLVSVTPSVYGSELYSFSLVPDPEAAEPAEAASQLVIPIASANNAAVLMGLPSLMPSLNSQGEVGVTNKAPLLGDQESLGNNGQAAIERWVGAFVRNDKETLTTLSGDPKSGTYNGMTPSGEPGRASIGAVVQHPTIPQLLVATVNFDVVYPDESTAAFSYLVGVYGSEERAEPYVVAWMPDGVPPAKMSLYMNRVAPATSRSTTTTTTIPVDGETPDESTVTTVVVEPVATTAKKKGG